jgi:hypothetical protein
MVETLTIEVQELSIAFQPVMVLLVAKPAAPSPETGMRN